jgi:hypothetical protein
VPRARHTCFARLRPLLLAPVAALLTVGLARASEPAAVVVWPPSSALLVGEVVTGGASASDEFVEIYNASETSASLAGLEVVYVSATGGTVTRKATWSDGAALPSRHHLLLANAAGSYASGADITYSGGFAPSGGAIVLRAVGGQPIDVIAWGDASSAFVEGVPAAAPPAASSIERGPGGSGGNWFDTNDNAADTLIHPAPIAQNLLAPAAPPDAAGSPSPVPTAADTETPTATETPAAQTETPAAATETPVAQTETTAAPTETTAASTATPIATAADSSLAAPTSTPTSTQTSTGSPTITPAATQSSSTTPTAPVMSPSIAMPIASARVQPPGSVVAIVGTVTAESGRVIDGRTLVVQDETGGLAVRLPVGSWTTARRGDRVALSGALAQPYGNQLVQLARPEDLTLIGAGDIHSPLGVSQLEESVEGMIVRVQGRVTSVERRATTTVSALLEGTSSTIRIVALRTSGVPVDVLGPGQQVIAVGIAGQRATQSDAGYRVWLRDEDDLQPGPTPTPTARPTATAGATPRPSATAEPSSTPAASPPLVSIAQARARIGQSVSVQGVTTVRVGLLDADARRVTIEDASGGILVRLPANGIRPQPGDRLRIQGKVGTYYGAPQLAAAAAVVTSRGRPPTPLVIRDGPIAERLEWRLVRVSGTVRTIERGGKAWHVELATGTSAVPVHGDARAAIASTRLQKGVRLTVTGIVRRPRSNAADRRFTLVPRVAGDLIVTKAATAASSKASATQNAGGAGTRAGGNTSGSQPESSALRDVDLARLRAYEGQVVRVGGLLIARTGFVITLRDGTGSADARLPAAASAALSELSLGEPLNVTGRVRKSGPARWEVVVETPGDLVQVGSLEAGSNATQGAGALPTPPGLGLAGSFPGSLDRWRATGPGSGTMGTAALVPPVLLLLGLVSAGLWAVGIYLRRRNRAE